MTSVGLVDITIPSDQREGNQASVHRWLKNVGNAVLKNEPLLEINTDKVTLEVVAPASGILTEILKNPKDACELNEVFGRIAIGQSSSRSVTSEPAQSISSTSNHSELSSSATLGAVISNNRLSPAVRNLSTVRGIDATKIVGSGRGGRVTARDLEKAAAALQSKPTQVERNDTSGDILVPHTPMRRAIAHEMSRSVTIAPHVTSVFECDFDALLTHRRKHKDEFAKRGVKLTVTPYLLHAAAKALKEVPEVNASWHDDHISLHSQINIGVATAIENAQGGGAGLVVPVVRDVATLELFEIAQELQRTGDLSRKGKLSGKDLSGGTFTISNHGMGGSLFAAPIIILQPQVAILGVGKVERRVVVAEKRGSNGETSEIFTARARAYVTLTIDHRALDGFTANKFLTIFATSLQQWE